MTFLTIFRAVPFWVWLLVTSLGWGGFQHHRATAAGQEVLKVQTELATLRQSAAQAAIDSLAQTLATQAKATDEAQKRSIVIQAGADSLAVSLGKLRDYAAALERRCAKGPAASGSAPAADGPDLCPKLLSRMGEAGGRIAVLADKRGNAGTTAEEAVK